MEFIVEKLIQKLINIGIRFEKLDFEKINLKPNNQKLKERLSRIKNLRTDDD